VNYVNYSIHLPDPELLERIKEVAKQRNISPGAFIREAAEKAVIKHEKQKQKESRAA
jgi:predicted DNA-binding protein